MTVREHTLYGFTHLKFTDLFRAQQCGVVWFGLVVLCFANNVCVRLYPALQTDWLPDTPLCVSAHLPL